MTVAVEISAEAVIFLSNSHCDKLSVLMVFLTSRYNYNTNCRQVQTVLIYSAYRLIFIAKKIANIIGLVILFFCALNRLGIICSNLVIIYLRIISYIIFLDYCFP